MNTTNPIRTLRAGDYALCAVEFELLGLEDEHPHQEFCCKINCYQKVLVASAPRERIHPETGQALTIVSIKVPDTNGKERTLTVALDMLKFAANDNQTRT